MICKLNGCRLPCNKKAAYTDMKLQKLKFTNLKINWWLLNISIFAMNNNWNDIHKLWITHYYWMTMVGNAGTSGILIKEIY